MLQAGNKAPDFTLESYSAEKGLTNIQLSSLEGNIVILAFYPKDDTPGCTKEMCSFRDDWETFRKKGISVFGISQDSTESHKKFAEKYDFKSLELLADTEGKVSDLYLGADYPKRTLFVIDKTGNINKIIEGMPNNAELLSLCESL